MSFNLLASTMKTIIFTIILCSTKIFGENEIDYQCAGNKNFCNPHFQHPCCHEHDSCKVVFGFHLCIREGQLGSLCETEEDCQNIRHAICSKEKRCACRPNNIENGECLPLLGAFCWKNEKCAVNNSICFNNECKCKYEYKQQAKDQCVPFTLGRVCSNNADCYPMKFERCLNKICTCEQNTVLVNNSVCLPQLNIPCDNNANCRIDNSACIDGVCRCRKTFVDHGNSECKSVYLGMYCQYDSDCYPIEHSVCSEINDCICERRFFSISNKLCVTGIDFTCEANQQCKMNNSACIYNQCQCQLGYVYQGNECVLVLPFLNQKCTKNTDCHAIRFAECSADKECVCSERYSAISNGVCAPLIGETCENNVRCFASNSVCVDNRCLCKPNYIEENNECIPKLLGQFCKNDSSCKLITNSRCSSLGMCICDSNHRALNQSACIPVLNGFCSNQVECQLYGFTCINNKCQCKFNFTSISSSQCIETHLLSDCESVSECSDLWHFKCSKKKCVCQVDNVATTKFTCLPTLKGYCWKDSQCMTENSICDDYRCMCKKGFIAVAINICLAYDKI